MASIKANPKAVAQVLTAEGFMRWAEGKKLRQQDFKRP